MSLRKKICLTLAILLVVITFTPLVIPKNEFHPQLFGIPYTLWTGFLTTLGLVILTWIISKDYAHKEEEPPK